MKIILMLSLIVLSSMAEYIYEKGEIDTHGGKYDNAYERKKGGFTNNAASMSSFLSMDNNSTKESKK